MVVTDLGDDPIDDNNGIEDSTIYHNHTDVKFDKGLVNEEEHSDNPIKNIHLDNHDHIQDNGFI